MSAFARTGAWGVLYVAAGLAVGGCSRPYARSGGPQVGPPRHLLFDAISTPLAGAEFPRLDWPSTDGFSQDLEFVVYREVILDRQGFGWDTHNQPYRRFDSIRVGRASRR